LKKKKEVFLKKMGNDQEAMIKESSSLKKEWAKMKLSLQESDLENRCLARELWQQPKRRNMVKSRHF
jgi:hypothetical protein